MEWGRFKMCFCTWGIWATPRKMKRRSSKSLWTMSLCCSIVKSTLKVPLTFNKGEKNKQKIRFCSASLFLFLLFFSSSFAMHNSKTIRCKRILKTPKNCSANGDNPYLFEAACELLLESYGLGTISPERNAVWFWHYFGFSRNNCRCLRMRSRLLRLRVSSFWFCLLTWSFWRPFNATENDLFDIRSVIQLVFKGEYVWLAVMATCE